MTFGESLTDPLIQIDVALQNYCIERGIKPDFPIDGTIAIINIFCSLMLDKMVTIQNADNMEIEDRFNMGKKMYEDLQKFMHTYTNINIGDLVSELQNEL